MELPSNTHPTAPRWEYSVVLLFFTALSLLKMWPALFSPDVTLISEGDAQGTLGWIYDIGQKFRAEGLSMLWGDFYTTDRFGGGILSQFPVINPLWKALYAPLTLFLSVDDVYDVICLVGFVLQGIIGFHVGRRISLSRGFAFLFSLFLLSLENTAARLPCHIGLAYISVPLLFLLWVRDAAISPSYTRFFRAAFGLWLSFLFNEYLAYFGAWAGAALFVALRAREKSMSWPLEMRAWIGPTLGAGTLLVLLLSLSHPATLWGRFYLPPAEAAPRIANPFWQFQVFSLKNPLAPFRPGFDFLVSLTPSVLWRQRTWEFTFRIGMLAPVLLVGFWCSLKKLRRKQSLLLTKFEPVWGHVKPWLWVALVLFLLGLHPQYRALSWLTVWAAPMFRVSARAYFFFDVAVIAAFFIAVQGLWQFRAEFLSIRWTAHSKLTAGLCVLFLWLTYFDLSGRSHPFWIYATYSLPETVSLARTLSDEPPGMVLELPFFSEAEGAKPEQSYAALMHTAFHRKPTLNGVLNHKWSDALGRFSWLMQNPSEQSMSFLRAVGVRYLLVWKEYTHLSELIMLPGLRPIRSTKAGALLEVRDATSWDRTRFVALASELPAHPFSPEGRP